MALVKNIVTFFLALLLVNPACCCALNGCGATEVPARSCCSEPTENQDDEGEEHQCMCSVNDQFAETKKIDFSSPDLTGIPVPSVVTVLDDIFALELVVITPCVTGHPPSPPMRIMYSVFRL